MSQQIPQRADPSGLEREAGAYTVEIHHRIAEIPRADWNSMLADGSPFMEWDWLASLEESGCASIETGWAPHHVLLRRDGVPVAAAPLYLKGHSQGEFVFDHQWAYAAQQAGLGYYPKLLVAVPFTPAAGIRVLTAPGAQRPPLICLVGSVLAKLCREHNISSVHINFCDSDEATALETQGFLQRNGIQYHWENHGYGDFEDYLAMFRSKRRNKIRRERKEMDALGIEIKVLRGNKIPDSLIPVMYQLYKTHIEKLYWGNLYLNEQFFELLGERCRDNLCFVIAQREGKPIAGTFNVQKHGVFYGRYWGAFQELRHLHFNVCYYAAIEHCIRDEVQRFEPGAGGDFKQLRGFEPCVTRSMHYLHPPAFHEAIGQFLAQERRQVERTAQWYTSHSQLKPVTDRQEGT